MYEFCTVHTHLTLRENTVYGHEIDKKIVKNTWDSMLTNQVLSIIRGIVNWIQEERGHTAKFENPIFVQYK